MIWLYRLLYWPMFVLLMPKYMWRLWRRGGKWHLKERFGIIHPPAKTPGVRRVWLHAVSVGELNSLRPMLQAMKEMPKVEVVLSVTTTTARALAEEKLAGFYSYLMTFPLDHCTPAVLARLQPDKIVLLDSELWPELLNAAYLRKVPVVIVNARLSDRSYARMRALPGPVSWVMKRLSLILTATTQDTERYLSLGANPELVYQTGNLKFDTAQSREINDAQRQELLTSLGWSAKDRIVVGASTWPGEEAALINAFQELKAAHPALKLLLVPRHAERREELETLLAGSGLSYHRRTAGAVTGTPKVVLADTTGELSWFIHLAEVVFVGKSLRPHTEGQTPIEAAAAGKPVLMGTGMSNFRLIARDLVAEHGGAFVAGPQELKEKLQELLANEPLRTQMGAAAQAWYHKNRGATRRVLEYLELEERVRV